MTTINVQLSNGGKVPSRQTAGSVGHDLYSNEEYHLQPGERKLIGTGVQLDTGRNDLLCLIKPRSSLAVRGIDVGAGVGDADYTGEYKVLLINNSNKVFHVQVGDRIAQMIFVQVVQPTFNVVDEVTHTVRGVGGFGSTGTN